MNSTGMDLIDKLTVFSHCFDDTHVFIQLIPIRIINLYNFNLLQTQASKDNNFHETTHFSYHHMIAYFVS